MRPLNLEKVEKYVKQNIGKFHKARLDRIGDIKLNEILRKKNPYLFKAKNVKKASEIIEGILSAHISSSEEGVFGNWLERLAIFVCESVYNGKKAAIPGIDLDFNVGKRRYLVTIKSGPAWGNDDQVTKMIDNFNSARKRLRTSGASVQVIYVNGCCYGRSRPSSEFKTKGQYYKKCGKEFWELISGDPTLYTKLVIPLGYQAKQQNDKFKSSYEALVNRFTFEFLKEYSDSNGNIRWEKLIEYISSWPIKKKSVPNKVYKKVASSHMVAQKKNKKV
jgi:Type II restriction endonuclease EcoO109I